LAGKLKILVFLKLLESHFKIASKSLFWREIQAFLKIATKNHVFKAHKDQFVPPRDMKCGADCYVCLVLVNKNSSVMTRSPSAIFLTQHEAKK